jgi:non-heme Fe2+,alpha-ketoglutarate-dependent halogenase
MSSFYDDGYIGPFDGVLSSAEVDDIHKKILAHSRDKEDRHPIYGRYAVRDWYLVYPELIKFVSHPQVLNQLKSIMGEDLILWRSNVFYKPPGTGPIGWHQDFGTFSGEDIGNNKPSLLPTHLKGVNEELLRKYLPDTLKQSSSELAPDQSKFWNMTLWVALHDIDENMGPLRFLKGTHKKRFPVRMSPLTESDFWQDPFANINNKTQLINTCNNSSLVLDVDTSHILKDVRLDEYSYEELKEFILSKLGAMEGSTTVTDEVEERKITNLPMKKGSYVIFSERTMHGSSANTSNKERIAINFRITPSSTLIYPSRLKGDFIDGFNLDVTNHKSILLSGKNLNPSNNVMVLKEHFGHTEINT